jgi:lipopolysaccharide assembly outer membrane protein LptD (OstA)
LTAVVWGGVMREAAWGQDAGRGGAAAAPAGAGTGENLIIITKKATTWVDQANAQVNIVQLEGGVTIELDRTKMSADSAVVWLTPIKGGLLEQQAAQVALLGNAVIEQPGQARREGDRLFVTANVRGAIRVTAEDRVVGNAQETEIYKAGNALRPLRADAPPSEIDTWLTQPLPPSEVATTQATTQPGKKNEPVTFSADRVENPETVDGKVVFVVTGNVKLFQRRAADQLIELQADRAVLFTPLTSLNELQRSERFKKVEDAVTAAYLEGDVRITLTPPPGVKGKVEQRLAANRAYYDFETDRAVLTDAVIHTIEPQRNIPIVVRAKVVRQLSLGEYKGEQVQLTQSSFFTPSYHIGMNQAYVRQVETGDPRYGTRTYFTGRDVTFNAVGVPFFWLPGVAGEFTQRGGALRDVGIEGGSKFGYGFTTNWGLLETLGQLPPKDLDLSFHLDWFSERGPAVGLDGEYAGGFVTQQDRQPWNFTGRLTSYLVVDQGKDELGRHRVDVEPPQELRYRLIWEHQHFFPDDWQVQLSTGLFSDATFYEEWFKHEFDGSRDMDTALYVKRQKQTEAFTALFSIQPNDFVTTSQLQQEQTEVERVPEIGYHRIGETTGRGRGDEGLTWFSDNVVTALRFQNSSAPLQAPAGEDDGQGFRVRGPIDKRAVPGLASFGQTGTPTDVTYRGDFRQEVDFPFTMGQFRFVPYVVGRYTVYTQSPDESNNDRLFAGAGMRMTTAFWKVDDSAHSDLLDIHRLRHVIEPEVNLFTSAQTLDRSHLFWYDEQIDEITDITAVQIALRQRWQTKRGGAGRWRSVDVFTLNVEANFFNNPPPDDELAPVQFRGLYFSSMPEASVPRNSINADAFWRISDTTAVLLDAQYNMDDGNLATASAGLAVSRDERLGYFLGVRYIDSGPFVEFPNSALAFDEELHSVVVTGAANYKLTPNYTLAGHVSYDFGERERVLNYLSVIREFDRWYMSFTVRVDYIGEDSGVFFNIWPTGLGKAAKAGEQLEQVFRAR